MKLRFLALCCAAAWSAGSSPAAPPPAASPTKSPADASTPTIEVGHAAGWEFPIFTDKEGYHVLTLRGAQAEIISADQVNVTDFSAFVFSGDASERVETVLLSPQATFYPKLYRATGDSPVRLIHDDIEVTGRGWTYDHNTKKVSLAHDVRVTFHAQLSDILK
ncbi:MAG TPA: LPS export ABC transporter periplasmic protein LptC [Opitutaceae bacterium]|nr:LPS export ABC transporter periplasmic protein LptC [Opitutaceae bacterium]